MVTFSLVCLAVAAFFLARSIPVFYHCLKDDWFGEAISPRSND